MQPLVEPDELWQVDPNECCTLRKVEPLARALDGKQAWMTGLRRAEAATRAKAPIVGLDVGRGIVKVNPIATVDRRRRRGLRKPTTSCPSTRSRRTGTCRSAAGRAPARSPTARTPGPGAGPGTGKVECGLHGWPEPR